MLFVALPVVLAGVLLWRRPSCRRVRPWRIVGYIVILGVLLGAALLFVGHAATARVPPVEVLIALWFTIGWRLAWELWARTVGRLGQRWVRWGRWRRRRGRPVPWAIRCIRPGRAALTVLVFAPAFLSMVVTHRVKLHDGQDPMAVLGMSFEHVRIPTEDGLALDGWFIPQAGADRTMVICHGAGANKGNFVWFLAPLAYEGYNVLFFDFRAHGASDGRVTTWGLRERLDVAAAVDWLKRERPEQARVVVGLGSSQGAMALALAAAEDERIDAVILDSPFVSPRALLHHHARRLPVAGPAVADYLLAWASASARCNFFAFSAEEAVASLTDRPVMVIHGADDFLMPAGHARRLYDAAPGPREIWFGPGAHSNIVTTTPGGYGRRVLGFLDAHFGVSGAAASGLDVIE